MDTPGNKIAPRLEKSISSLAWLPPHIKYVVENTDHDDRYTKELMGYKLLPTATIQCGKHRVEKWSEW
jgi:hypothetical protein